MASMQYQAAKAGRVVGARAKMTVKTLRDRSIQHMTSAFPRWRSLRKTRTGRAVSPSVRARRMGCLNSIQSMRTSKRI